MLVFSWAFEFLGLCYRDNGKENGNNSHSRTYIRVSGEHYTLYWVAVKELNLEVSQN